MDSSFSSNLNASITNDFFTIFSKSLHALCYGCMEFNRGVEIMGYINIKIDCENKIDYVLNEKINKLSKTDTVTFVSDSFVAQKDKSVATSTRDASQSPIPNHILSEDITLNNESHVCSENASKKCNSKLRRRQRSAKVKGKKLQIDSTESLNSVEHPWPSRRSPSHESDTSESNECSTKDPRCNDNEFDHKVNDACRKQSYDYGHNQHSINRFTEEIEINYPGSSCFPLNLENHPPSLDPMLQNCELKDENDDYETNDSIKADKETFLKICVSSGDAANVSTEPNLNLSFPSSSNWSEKQPLPIISTDSINLSTTPSLKIQSAKKTPKKTLSAREYMRKYRASIKADPERYKALCESERKRKRNYKLIRTEAQKQKKLESMRMYRERKRQEAAAAGTLVVSKPILKKPAAGAKSADVEYRRELNRKSVKNYRARLSKQIRAEINRKRMQKYYEQKYGIWPLSTVPQLIDSSAK